MSIWGIFISAFLIGFSGAMMPGPLLGVTIEGSLKRGYIAGPLVVLGHGILEFTLVFAMAFGLREFFSNPIIAGLIGILGGGFLAWMGYDMIKSSLKKTVSLEDQENGGMGHRNLILAGIVVSATNPYFILWWASTGMESIRQAYTMGVLGILAFYFGHILSDFTWYVAISTAFSKGKKLMNDTVYRWVILCLGAFILIFSVRFIIGGWQMLF
ncbi:MAG: LysE family transporter [Caldicoprobacterales bacterium]|nr:LysE family transporter [Clostridiales bacterium]